MSKLNLTPKTTSVVIGGKEITFETGKIGNQASGAVIIRSGDTILLSTACSGPSPEGTDFLPLKVDYTEKFSSAGKTLGGFIKREGRPTERTTLIARLTDRPIRPMFEEGYFNDIQVITSVISYDGVHTPEPLAICGASAALVISDIPLIKPIGAVRVGLVDGKFVVNPTAQEQEQSKLDLILAGTADAILMIEGYCDFLSEEQVMEAIEVGHEGIKEICHTLDAWQKVVGKEKKKDDLRLIPKELITKVDEMIKGPLAPAIRIQDKKEREEALNTINSEVIETLFPEGKEESAYTESQVKSALKEVTSSHMRAMILNEGVRCDGRSTEDIRPIEIEMGLLPRTHGSALFTRGETQSLAVCTLGGENMGQRFETLDEDGLSRFYLQYSFPPFSVGEVGRMGAPGRREIGHGKLAERALMSTVPNKDNFPYTIRVESTITGCNGSSSMASVCGGCLALMEAGVPIKRPIAGIAMGLIIEGDRHVILSDILGVEDALGDMDFKITGDKEGITAFQLDIKVEGITQEVMRAALEQAKRGRIHILDQMLEVCPKPKDDLSVYAPRIETVKIKVSQIGTVIGPGGKQIKAITEETGVEVTIDDDGYVSLASTDPEGMRRAKEIIYDLTAEVEVNKIYKGTIAGIKDFGVFVAVPGNKQGLCHISQLSHERIENIHDHYKEGDSLEVKVLEIDAAGKIRLSHKAIAKSNS